MGSDALGDVVGNAHLRAQSCGATGRDDLHVLQISRLQAQLTTNATENMRATILAILLAAGAMILGLAIGLIISGIISGDISDIWSNWRALVH